MAAKRFKGNDDRLASYHLSLIPIRQGEAPSVIVASVPVRLVYRAAAAGDRLSAPSWFWHHPVFAPQVLRRRERLLGPGQFGSGGGEEAGLERRGAGEGKEHPVGCCNLWWRGWVDVLSRHQTHSDFSSRSTGSGSKCKGYRARELAL